MDKNVRRAWIVTAGLFLLYASMFVVPNTGFALLMTSVCQAMNITVTQISLYFTFFGISMILTNAVLMKVVQRIGYRTTMIGANLIGAASFASLTIATEVWHICVIGFLIGFCVVAVMGTVPVVARNWFANGGSTATGIATAGSGIAGAVLSLVLTNVLAAGDWRMAAYVGAGWLLVVGLIAIIFFVRFSPEEVGMEPVADKSAAAAAALAADVELSGMTFEDARKSGTFYLLGIIAFAYNFLTTLNVQTASMLGNSSFVQQTIGTIVALQMISIAVGKIALGAIRDKTHSAVITTFICLGCYVAAAAMFIIGLSGGNVTLMYVAQLPLGLGVSCMNILVPADVLEVVGPKGFASTFGPVMAIASFASLVTSLSFNGLYEASGSYTAPILMLIGIAMVACVLTVVVVRRGESYKKSLGQEA